MADAKITALTENTAPVNTDILPMVDAPGGTPATQKITIENLLFYQTRFFIGTISRDLTAVSGDVAYTGVGFQPKTIAFIATKDASTNAPSIGFDNGTTHYSIDNENGTYYYESAKGFYITDGAAGQTAIVKTLDADGFTLTWTKGGSPTGTGRVIYLAFR